MNQKGFTLVELLVFVAVGGLVMVGVLGIIFQVLWNSSRGNERVEALNDVSYATEWIKRDIKMAQYVDLINGNPTPQSSVELWWIDYTSFATENQSTHSSTYTLSDTELLRTYDDTTMIIGRHITYLGFTRNDTVITCNITATGSRFKERLRNLVFDVNMRSGGYWQ